VPPVAGRGALAPLLRGEASGTRNVVTNRILNWVFAAAVFLPVPAGSAELSQLALPGQLNVAGDTRAASLRLLCNPDRDGGAIGVELWVPRAYTLKDFDYDDFEGPDAAAADRALSRLSVDGKPGTTEIAHAASGWYAGDEPDTFVFALSELAHRQGEIAAFLRAVDAKRTQLVWVQTGFDDPKRQLRATFALDAATVERIHATVDVCLMPAAQPPATADK
jgi:hypothetical protein